MNIVLSFLKTFIIKYLSSVAIEKTIIILLEALVKRTDSDIDDKIFNIVFKQTDAGQYEEYKNYKADK